jgi:hypothetical protein
MIKCGTDTGAITAVGTADRPIVFAGTSAVAGYWGGLYFFNTNDADPLQPRSRLEHVRIEHGGAYSFNDSNAQAVSGNLVLDSSGFNVAVELNHSTVRESAGYGVWLACLASLSGSDNTFGENARGDRGQETNCN